MSTADPSPEARITQLDLTLFEPIESQTSANDRRSLLACQRAVRSLVDDGYRYLEIGSHRGGSIQPHLVDPRCVAIVSIDNRPRHQPDERGVRFTYEDNTTARMLGLLAGVAPIDKITTVEGTSSDLDPATIGEPVQLCFIDGEHTDVAATADFELCLTSLDTRGAIVFHDAAITYRAISACLERVEDRDPIAYVLPDMVFVIEFGGFAIHDDPHVQAALLRNHEAYLFGLHLNDPYRDFANRAMFRRPREVLNRLRRANRLP